MLCFGLAALIEFYKGSEENGKYYGIRNGIKYELRDDPLTLAFFTQAWRGGDVVKKVLANDSLWGRDLTEVRGLCEKVGSDLEDIEALGMKKAAAALAESI